MANEQTITLEDILSDSGLVRVASDLRAMVRPAIRLQFALTNEEAPIGTTRIGGDPDLPHDTVWPKMLVEAPPPSPEFAAARPDDIPPPNGIISLPFVAQICLSDVAGNDSKNLLPESGLLSFFFNDKAYASDGGNPSDAPIHSHEAGQSYSYNLYGWDALGKWRVLYTPADTPLVRIPSPSEVPDTERYKPCVLESVQVMQTLPKVETSYVGEPAGKHGILALTKEEWELYADLHHEATSDTPRHLMLGHWDNPQPYTMEGAYERVRETFFAPAQPWESLSDDEKLREYQEACVLFQLDANESGMWFGRAGVLFSTYANRICKKAISAAFGQQRSSF